MTMDKFRNVLPKVLGPHLVVDAVRATLHYAPNSPGRSYAPLSHIVPDAVVHRLMLPHPLIGFGLVCVESCSGLQVLTHHVLKLLCPSVYTGWAATLLVAQSFTPTTPILPTGPPPLPFNPCAARCSCSSPCRQCTSIRLTWARKQHPALLTRRRRPVQQQPCRLLPDAKCSVQMHDGYPCGWLCKDKCQRPILQLQVCPLHHRLWAHREHRLIHTLSATVPLFWRRMLHCALVEPQ